MNKNNLVVVLDDLIAYINDQWDKEDEEIIDSARLNIMALNEAIKIIKKSKVVGTLNVKNKEYIIYE